MATSKISAKRLLIDKANSTIVIVVSIASFVTVFSLVASRSLISQMGYQNKVISRKEETLDTLTNNIEATDKLEASYKNFVSQPVNIIGKNSGGTDSGEGDNAQITLNALPSKYDFPALISSLEKLATAQNLAIDSITGTDDEIAQSKNSSNPAPVPVEIPFQIKATGTYDDSRKFLDTLQKSIRPFVVTRVVMSGGSQTLNITVTGKTYYQPAKTFNITKEDVN